MLFSVRLLCRQLACEGSQLQCQFWQDSQTSWGILRQDVLESLLMLLEREREKGLDIKTFSLWNVSFTNHEQSRLAVPVRIGVACPEQGDVPISAEAALWSQAWISIIEAYSNSMQLGILA